MRILFLDIDGVLNDHSSLPSGYSGIQIDKAMLLNQILKQCPDVQIVISSAWRYYILKGDMTLKGFEGMLLCFGVQCYQRIHGHTKADGTDLGEYVEGESSKEAWAEDGMRWRGECCQAYAEAHGCTNYVILDDLALDHPNLVQTNGSRGLTIKEATEVIRRFSECQI